MKLIGLILIMLFSSCSVQKRCERKLKKAQQMGCLSITNDTITKYDTLIGFKFDTLFIGRNEIDTFWSDTGLVKVQTIVRWRTKDIVQQITQKDTIFTTKYVNKTTTLKVYPSWVKIGKRLLFLFLLYLVIRGVIHLTVKE